MRAVILAAGKGTRLLPLTKLVPKPLILIANKPLLLYLLEKVRGLDILGISMIVNYLNPQIKNAFSGFGLNYVFQDELLGTGHAVGCAECDDKVLVINGDLFFDASVLDEVIKAGRSYDGVILVREVPDPENYGVIELDETGFMKRIVEKPANPQSNLVNAGVYVFPKEIFEVIKETPKSERGEIEITTSIEMLLEKGFKFKPVVIDSYWFDIGRPQNVLDANATALKNLGFDKLIHASSKVSAIILPYTSVSSKCVIKNSEITNSIIFDNVEIRNCNIKNSIIGPNVILEGERISNEMVIPDERKKF